MRAYNPAYEGLFSSNSLSHHGIKGMKWGVRRVDTDGDGRVDSITAQGPGGAITVDDFTAGFDLDALKQNLTSRLKENLDMVFLRDVANLSTDLVRKGASLVDRIDGKGNALASVTTALRDFANGMNDLAQLVDRRVRSSTRKSKPSIRKTDFAQEFDRRRKASISKTVNAYGENGADMLNTSKVKRR